MIVAVWYYVGVLLNNDKVKGSAIAEFYQFIGTAIMIGVIIGTMAMLASVYYSALGATNLMNPTAIYKQCYSVAINTSFDYIDAVLLPTAGTTNNAPKICDLVYNSGSTPDLTTELDYPLAATTVILANITNQTVSNLNSTFTIDAFLGYLSKLTPTLGLCVAVKNKNACNAPLIGASPDIDTEIGFTPYAGYSMLYQNLQPLGQLLSLSVISLVVQMLFVSVFLYIWPYLLCAGLVLRSTFLTRSIGGLLIAIVVGVLLIYPTIYAFEYLALGNGPPITPGNTQFAQARNAILTPYGYGFLTSLPAPPNAPIAGWPPPLVVTGCDLSNPGSIGVCVADTKILSAGSEITSYYSINFFVQPNIKAIAYENSCWPNFFGYKVNGLLSVDVLNMAYLMIPLASWASTAFFIGNLVGYLASPNADIHFPLPSHCSSGNASSTFLEMLKAYGIIGVDAFLIPAINIVLTLSVILGLSQLFGGDTSLAGLSNII